jgi:uncharacterized membrane protein
VASLFGSALVVIIGSFFYEFKIYQFIIVILSGFTGSLIDSLLGATVQGQFKCKTCGKITESKIHCGINTTIVKGKTLIDNDFVNIFSISFSAILTFFILFKDNL